MTNWNCKKCNGEGMYPTGAGMTICDCKDGDRRKRWLELTEKERKAEYQKRTGRRRGKDKGNKTPEEGQEVIPF